MANVGKNIEVKTQAEKNQLVLDVVGSNAQTARGKKERIAKELKDHNCATVDELLLELINNETQSLKNLQESRKAELAALPRYAHYFFYRTHLPTAILNSPLVVQPFLDSMKELFVPISESIVNIIRNQSFDTAPWSRERKRDKGENLYNCQGIETTDNGKWGFKKVVWHSANYFVVMNKVKDRFFYRLANGEQKEVEIKDGRFELFGTMYVHHSSVIRAGSGIRFVKDESSRYGANTYMFVDSTGEQFHINGGEYATEEEAGKSFSAAVYAFQQRRTEKEISGYKDKLQQLMAKNADCIFVSIEDSTRSGNCEMGTKNFAAVLQQKIGATGEIGAATVSQILEVKNDQFTQRACLHATNRYVQDNLLTL